MLASAVVAGWSPPVLACGGMFCSSRPGAVISAPQPVDQNAERILFEVIGDRVIAHIQIQYAGGADEFAWVVPVPGVPEVDESTPALIPSVDQASTMTVRMPLSLPCDAPRVSSSGGGPSCGCGSAGDAASPPSAGGRDLPGSSPVAVYGRSTTSNYEYAIIGAERSEDLVEWLQLNDYNVSDNMIPLMDPYSLSGMNFLALKLRDGRTANEIAPLKITYRSHAPMIPIQLTAVAAQPLMGIIVMILSDRPYAPQNFEAIEVDPNEIVYDSMGNTSYFEWVARKAAESNGTIFVTELIGSESRFFVGTSSAHTTLSRYYTRLSPEHMTVDPVFVPSGMPHDPQRVGFWRSNQIDLSAQPPVVDCTTPIPEAQPSPCAFNYCGLDSTCVVMDGAPSCRCSEDRVAQPVTGPDGTRKVTCVPKVNPFGVTPEAVGAGTAFDVCADVHCGLGECTNKGGFAACACDPEAAAALMIDGATFCVPLDAAAATFGPGAGPESRGLDVRIEQASTTSIALAVVLACAWGVLRRRGRPRV
jgi:hypothetical protein